MLLFFLFWCDMWKLQNQSRVKSRDERRIKQTNNKHKQRKRGVSRSRSRTRKQNANQHVLNMQKFQADPPQVLHILPLG